MSTFNMLLRFALLDSMSIFSHDFFFFFIRAIWSEVRGKFMLNLNFLFYSLL